jgi:ethanolamine utilization microcompartment shell protein EutL
MIATAPQGLLARGRGASVLDMCCCCSVDAMLMRELDLETANYGAGLGATAEGSSVLGGQA